MNETIDELKRSLEILARHGIKLESFEMLLRNRAAALEKLAMAREALEFCRKMAIGEAEKEYLDKTIYAIREKP